MSEQGAHVDLGRQKVMLSGASPAGRQREHGDQEALALLAKALSLRTLTVLGG